MHHYQTLPKEIGGCKSLQELYASENSIQELPTTMVVRKHADHMVLYIVDQGSYLAYSSLSSDYPCYATLYI